jgi:hypothetical protein
MVRTPRIRVGIPDISKAVVVTVKQGDNDVLAWSTIWYSLASDGTDWHDALKQAQLSGPIAQHVEALSLHHFDISFCERILDVHHAKFVHDYSDLSLALWIAVVTKFMSCFQTSKARAKLDPRTVYGSDSTAFQNFELIKALRNKHVVHDQNSHYGATAFAWLEPNGDVRGVGPMIAVARIDPTLVTMMRNLVNATQDYIHVAMEDAGKALRISLSFGCSRANAGAVKVRRKMTTAIAESFLVIARDWFLVSGFLAHYRVLVKTC